MHTALKRESQQPSLAQTIQEISGLISLPEIYLKIRRLMDDPNSSIEEFCQVISCDPNLSATVLKVINSAFFGFPGQIDSIYRAVTMLGIGQVHDMVLATSAMKSLALPNEILPLKTFWRCSLFTGVLSRLLAKQLKIRKGEKLFIIGLLHEIGHLVIYSKYPEFAKLAIESFHTGYQSIHEAEKNLLGLHYGEVGAKLMGQWQLPVNFQEITHYQPVPAYAGEFEMETSLLHLAHGYAHKKFCETDMDIEQLILPDVWRVLDLVPGEVEDSLEKATNDCAEMEKTILS